MVKQIISSLFIAFLAGSSCTSQPGAGEYIDDLKETPLDPADVPADASSTAYFLVKVLEKKQDKRLGLNTSWKAIRIGDTLLEGDSSGLPQLEINVGEMRYTGTDGCNNFMGGLIELDDEVIRFGIAAGTRKMCSEMEIPDLFNKTLSEVETWEIRDRLLHLFGAQGKELMQLKEVD